jgi:hypothetical protein
MSTGISASAANVQRSLGDRSGEREMGSHHVLATREMKHRADRLIAAKNPVAPIWNHRSLSLLVEKVTARLPSKSIATARTVIPSIAVHRSQGGSPGTGLSPSSSRSAYLTINEPDMYPENRPHRRRIIAWTSR